MHSDASQTSIFTRMTALAEQTGAVNLGQGFPDFDGPEVVIDAAIAALRAGHNQYAPLPGVPPLRQAIADHQRRRYGIELDPDREVQVTFGATEALAVGRCSRCSSPATRWRSSTRPTTPIPRSPRSPAATPPDHARAAALAGARRRRSPQRSARARACSC